MDSLGQLIKSLSSRSCHRLSLSIYSVIRGYGARAFGKLKVVANPTGK